MSGRIYKWDITNTTTGRVAFDDKALEAAQTVEVHRLTDDILAGWRQGRLLIAPDPGEAIPGLKEYIVLDPCQLPLPVRIIGTAAALSPNTVVDGGPIILLPAVATQIVPSDRRRVVLRVKNMGINTCWLGGASVTDATSLLPLAPGEIHTERDAPSAAWYAYNANLISNSVRTQQIFSGTV